MHAGNVLIGGPASPHGFGDHLRIEAGEQEQSRGAVPKNSGTPRGGRSCVPEGDETSVAKINNGG